MDWTPLGYDLPEPGSVDSFDEFRTAFSWTIPEEYDIATASLDHPQAVRARTALRHVDSAGRTHEFTYEHLDTAAAAVAAWLVDCGVSEGDRVAVSFPQSPELLLVHLAAYRLGAVVVPISVLLGADSLEYTLDNVSADLFVVDEMIRDRFENAGATLDRSAAVVAVPADPDRYGPGGAHLGGLRSVVKPRRRGPDVSSGPDDPALVLYTSGTTNRPKGVVVGHRYLVGSMPGFHCWFHLFDPAEFGDQCVWTPAEWAWAGALFDVVFPTLAIGGTLVSRERRSGFDPEGALAFLNEQGITRSFMPPTALHQIRDAVPDPDTTLPKLSVVQCGGEPLNEDLRVWAESTFDLVVNEGYGQTEANALAGECQALFEPHEGSLGRAYPGHNLLVIDEEGNPLPPGEPGELAVELPDPVAFLKYWDDPAATETRHNGDLLLTGDTVVLDADGYFYFRGRTDDLILSSGYRVSPVEVERALERHDAVAEAVVGGVPGPKRGQRVRAYVVPAPGATIEGATIERLRDLVRSDAGAHKVPHDIEVLPSPPTTRSGKVDRSALFEDEGS
ncbi:AMP-binding protein [Halobellus ordinarius]|uniref:AMP-binding protein n=1 Tax=Halobellus ordinarius TaxID=3075120 RepID=UPI002880702D|nr:AMP-binding protein [Halobellus sp. ZY16]